MSLQVLDCTLRDGGYYNGWCFERDLAVDYLRAVDRAGVDFVEIGFRRFSASSFLGPFAYTTENFLETLPDCKSSALGVMVDAKEILSSGLPPREAIDRLFVDARDSRLTLVRVAAHFDEVPHCRQIVEHLSHRGYRVGLNIMQIAGRPKDRVSELSAEVDDWSCVDVLYFADSMGSMGTSDVDDYHAAIRATWPGEIGIHTHNNKGQAVQNSLRASEIGVTWLDATLLGMGRGAGNAQLGILLSEFNQRGERCADLMDVYAVGEQHFEPLHDVHKWGPNFFYHFSALNGIHPMFAQTLLADHRYSPEEKFQALVSLASLESSRFDRESMDGLLSGISPAALIDEHAPFSVRQASAPGAYESDVASSLPRASFTDLEGKDVVIIGAGESVARYAVDVSHFIEQHPCTVFTLNQQSAISLDDVDGIFSVDQHRLVCEADFLASSGKPVFTSEHLVPRSVRKRLSDADLREYGCAMAPGRFEVHEEGCVIPVPLAIAYALAFCVAARVGRLFLIGFDGFEPLDPRQDQMLELLRLAEPALKDVELIALTPTSYPVQQGSIYANYR